MWSLRFKNVTVDPCWCRSVASFTIRSQRSLQETIIGTLSFLFSLNLLSCGDSVQKRLTLCKRKPESLSSKKISFNPLTAVRKRSLSPFDKWENMKLEKLQSFLEISGWAATLCHSILRSWWGCVPGNVATHSQECTSYNQEASTVMSFLLHFIKDWFEQYLLRSFQFLKVII